MCKRVENKTHILIFQHGRERHHPIGTSRIAQLTLARVQKMVAWKIVPKPNLLPGCALLFPGDDAKPLASLKKDEAPSQLIVLDGTWSHARVLYRENSWLQALPKVSLEPEEPSRYRIRAEPKPTCVSTIESIVQALKILEPETPDLENPLQVFDQMIDDQIALRKEHLSQNPVSRYQKARRDRRQN